MVDTFLAIPESTTSPVTRIVLDDEATAIVTAKPFLTYPYPYVTTYKYGIGIHPQNALFYHDSGISNNPIVIHDIAKSIRYKFLDKWLYDYDKIIKMLKVSNDKVIILSADNAEQNDISNDTEDVLVKKSDFIGWEILTLRKVAKILHLFVVKNNIKFYDIPYNESHVKHTIAKYVIKKLKSFEK